jgi:isochorismate pyruvate lyase
LNQKLDNRLRFAAIEPEQCKDIKEIRSGVDEIDLLLLDLLVRRQAYTVRAAHIKKAAGAPVRDEARITLQVERAKANGAERGISPIIVEPLFRTMIEQHVAFETSLYDRLS